MFLHLKGNVEYKRVIFVTRVTRRVPLVDQELLTIPENSSGPCFQ